MTHTAAVITAAFIHIVLRMTIFLEPDYKGCSPQTPTSSWLFLLSILEIVWDTHFIPERYKILPPWCLWLAEVCISVFLMEFCLIVIWCNLERLIYRSLKRVTVVIFPQLDHPKGDILVELVTIIISISIFYYVSQGTDIVYQLKKRYGKASKKVKRRASNIFQSISWIQQFKETSLELEEAAVDLEDGLIATSHRKLRRSPRLLTKYKKNLAGKKF